jgi:hypothetical protein
MIGWFNRLLAAARTPPTNYQTLLSWKKGGVFKRMVCVLGDNSIGTKLDQELWDKIHGTVVDHIRRGCPADGFCDAIAQSGEILRPHLFVTLAMQPISATN